MMNFFRKKNQYLFADPKNTACFNCKHVLDDHQPILFVSHDADDGAWQFLCGVHEHVNTDARVVSLDQIVVRDQTLNQLSGMPMGHTAERVGIGEGWAYSK